MRKFWNTFRKFGLEYCDLSTMIWNVAVMLRVMTLNIDSRYKKRIPICFYILTYGCMASYYYAYFVSMLWFLFVYSPRTGDLAAAMVVMSLGVSSEIVTMKLMYMLNNVKKIQRVVSEYLECDAQTIPGSRFSGNLLKVLRLVKKRAMAFWILIMVTGTIYIIIPVFQSGRHLPEDLHVIYGLEPMMESPNYEMAFFLMTSSVWFICFVLANMTVFTIIIVGYTEAQMLSLSKELVNVWDDAIQETFNTIDLKIKLISYFKTNELSFDKETTKKINREVKKRLVCLIQNHSRNIHLLHQVENIFRITIAVGFVCLTVGLIAELLGGLQNTFLQVIFTISQVAMDCWTGQRVMDASMVFAQAVYDCKWENFDIHNRKIVLVMLQISQRTLTLSAGGMTMLSFSCLMSIVRSIYSSYTTLRSLI